VSRRFSATRCDERNALCLCARCHHHYTDRPVEFGVFVIGMMGSTEYAALNARAQRVKKMDWQAEVERLRARLAELEPA
jgi:hypothetical protein